ncbi:hypothetical protein [Piscinibacter sakaiensis]|uniref:hypothetical protein n=1 Tax=Piscinibacter sakaiensis TaxID=1547922 RepID=UPI003AB103C0
MFNDTTYQELQPYAPADRLIAVIRCDAIDTVSPGSRSERQQIRGALLAGPASMPAGQPIMLSRYAQGAPLMKVGSSYLVAAYRESANGPWTLLEHREVKADAAASEWQAASADAARRLGGSAAPR